MPDRTGVGLVIRGGGVIDGAEVIAVFARRKTGFSNSEIIMLFNTIIFAIAAIQFGFESALYSIITYFTATRATNMWWTALNSIPPSTSFRPNRKRSKVFW